MCYSVAVEKTDIVGYMKTSHIYIGKTVADNEQGFIFHPSCSKRCYQSLTAKNKALHKLTQISGINGKFLTMCAREKGQEKLKSECQSIYRPDSPKMGLTDLVKYKLDLVELQEVRLTTLDIKV